MPTSHEPFANKDGYSKHVAEFAVGIMGVFACVALLWLGYIFGAMLR